jgi:DNA (cytosine-5)-methyltransferase 1
MKVIDLFCGGGGSTLGAKLAGHEVIAAYDYNRTFLDTYSKNHPEVQTYNENILDIQASDLPKGADILMGSTPCESFSRINMHGRTCDMALTEHFLELVGDYKPKYWVMENVPDIAKFLKAKDVPYQMLCAADYGVPQRRKRCIAGNFPVPVMTHRFGELTSHVTFGKIKDTGDISKHILSKKAIEGAYRRVHEMGLKGHHFKIKFVDENTVLNTITSSESHGVRAGSHIVYDNGRLRRLTMLECRRAQSFPDSYVLCGKESEQYKQINQAVPPLLMKAILTGLE